MQLQTTVRDADGNVLDDDRRTFNVPDLSGAALTISTPSLLRARTVADARAIADGRPAVPFAGREFNRTDRLYVRFDVHGSASKEAEVSARLTTRAGATLRELPVVSLNQGHQLEVPLTSIARGDYLIAVTAAHGEERTRALVPLRVLPF